MSYTDPHVSIPRSDFEKMMRMVEIVMHERGDSEAMELWAKYGPQEKDVRAIDALNAGLKRGGK